MATDFSKYGTPIKVNTTNSRTDFSKYGTPVVAPDKQPEKKDGIIKSIAKDVLGTLIVKPAARATEAVTRL